MIDFLGLIDSSIEWTKVVLFKPFSLKKWLILCFIALLAGTLSSSFNPNFRNKSTSKPKTTAEQQTQSIKQESNPDLPAVFAAAKEKALKNPILMVIIISAVLLVFLLLIFFIWLYSRFSFIFIEALAKNDVSVKRPFKTNKAIGNSFFRAMLVMDAVFMLAFGWLFFLMLRDIFQLTGSSLTTTEGPKQVLMALLPYAFTTVALIIVSWTLSLLISDFVQVVMFKDKIKFVPALNKSIEIINRNKGNFITYIFVKIGLGIASAIIFMILYLISVLILLIPGFIIGFIFYLLYQVLPHVIFFIILFIVLIPLFLVLTAFFMCLNLPISVFFRILSMKFIVRLDPDYNLFRQITPEIAP